ncbi:hypothetical protein BVX95_01740, partial [archaeon D22]
FRFKASDYTVRVDFNDESSIIKQGDCDYLGDSEVCIQLINYELKEDVYNIDVSITELNAKLKISSKFSSSKLYLGDKYTINIEIENEAEQIMSDFNYMLEFSDEIILMDCLDCIIENNSVLVRTKSLAAELIEFSFDFILVGKQDFNVAAKIDYTVNDLERQTYAEPIVFKPLVPFNIEYKDSKKKFEVGSQEQILVNVTSLLDHDIRFSKIFIYVPNDLEVKYKNKILSEGKVSQINTHKLNDQIVEDVLIYWEYDYETDTVEIIDNDIIPSNNNYLELFFDIIPKLSEDYIIYIDIYYQNNDCQLSHLSEKINVDSTLNDLNLEISPSSKSKIDSKSIHNTYVRVENFNEFLELHNLQLKIEGPILFNESITKTVEKIEMGLSKKIFEKQLEIPSVDKSASTYIQVNLTYEDQFRRKYHIGKKVEFTIEPIDEVSINVKGCTSKLKYGADCDYTIEIKNDLNGEVKDIFVREVFDSDNDIKEGLMYSRLSLDASETKTAYKYKINYPQSIREYVDKINIITLITYSYEGDLYENSKSRTLEFDEFIKPDNYYDISLSKTFDSSKFYVGRIYPVTLTIENKEDAPLYNIKVDSTLNEDLNYIDYQQIEIEKLNPKEKRIFTYEIQAKKQGDYTVQEVSTYEDENGFYYEKNFSNKKLTFEEGNIVGPIIDVSLLQIQKGGLGDQVGISLILSNIGNDAAFLNFSSFNRDHELTLGKDIVRSIKEYIVLQSKNTYVEPIEISYIYGGRKYKTISNSLSIESIEKNDTISEYEYDNMEKNENAAEEVIENLSSNLTNNINENNATNSNMAEDEEQRPSFFKRFINSLLSLFR